MPTFEWPWALLLLPLPYFVNRYLRPFEATERALRVPFMARLQSLLGERAARRARTRSTLQLAGLCLIWLLTVVAIARPMQLGARVAERRTLGLISFGDWRCDLRGGCGPCARDHRHARRGRSGR